MGRFFYQAHHILERHIKIGEKLSLADILEKGSMSTLRGSPLKFSTRIIEGEEVTVVSYEDIEARVVRGDLECSNGYIHIIDTVVMKRRDVTLSGGWVSLPSLLAIISALLLSAIIQ
ncbi:fasciclin-1-like [Eurytemora carolleeae]|uniref:fasciclin-1-like n=1 Tax=Eurytemora carolleeae TaxID=1294199 RepID=UPI000C7863AA|nr:fasciclin-1-like [Eurytemora carolleeae]|eukprot:XP_023339725.1 fasciclin-1-like [Eurytemora affinis]